MNGQLIHVVGRTPPSAPAPWSGSAGSMKERPKWASAADEGVCPTPETHAST
jgi:hypothetical protein